MAGLDALLDTTDGHINTGQRCAQFMGKIGDQPPLRNNQVTGTFRHAVKGIRQCSQLVVTVAQQLADTHPKVALGELTGGHFQFAQGSHQVAIDDQAHDHQDGQWQGHLQQQAGLRKVGSGTHAVRQKHKEMRTRVLEGHFHDRVGGKIQVDLPVHVPAQPESVPEPLIQFTTGQRLQIRPYHRGPGVLGLLQVTEPLGQPLLVSGPVKQFCLAPPVPDCLLVALRDEAHLLFGSGSKKGNRPEQQQGADRKRATQFPPQPPVHRKQYPCPCTVCSRSAATPTSASLRRTRLRCISRLRS